MTPEVWIVEAGQVPYEAARAVQKRLESERLDDAIPDVLLLLEHPPTYTKGRRSTPDELPMGEDTYRMQGIEVTDTDRGGRVTYHGPGQLVGYPIVSLSALANRAVPGPGAKDVARVDVVDYIRRMERVMIGALGEWGVEAACIEGLTGVWVNGNPATANAGASSRDEESFESRASGSGTRRGNDPRKIGSIGVHVNRGVTTHGFAINVNNDLQPFEWIVPCGIEACRVTSLSRELGSEQDIGAFTDTVARTFCDHYGREPAELGPAELVERVEGIESLAGLAPAGR